MISYSINWMGPVSLHWYRNRGIDHTTEEYSAGRIDIRDSSKEGYDGWDEYGVAPMHSKDWRALSDFLDRLHGEKVMTYDSLIMLFEAEYGKKIRWADDKWCPECYMTLPQHKMDCSRNR